MERITGYFKNKRKLVDSNKSFFFNRIIKNKKTVDNTVLIEKQMGVDKFLAMKFNANKWKVLIPAVVLSVLMYNNFHGWFGNIFDRNSFKRYVLSKFMTVKLVQRFKIVKSEYINIMHPSFYEDISKKFVNIDHKNVDGFTR